MSFDDRKQEFSREPFKIVEIEVDYCQNTFSESPCTATASNPDDNCYNTLASCQDLPNFIDEPKIYRFCEQRSPHPIGLEAIPSLRSISMAPAEIKIDGGLSVNASVSLTFDDHPASDIDTDKYVDERSYIAFERGTYWTKWRARNPFYYGRKLRVITGYLVNGEYDPANFQTRHYIMDSVDVSGGQCRMKGKDPLKLADDKKAQAPRASTGTLAAAITETDTNLTLQPAGVGDAEYPASGFIRISSEVMSFTRTSDTFTITRGEYNTQISDHDIDDTAQLCLLYNDQIDFIIADLLTTYAGIDSAFIPTARWSSEVNDFQQGLLQTIITEPVGVKKLLKELGEQAPHNLYWDERTQTIELNCVKPPPIDARLLDDNSNIIAGSFNVSDKDDMRVNTVYVYFGQIDPTKKLDETNNYSQTYVRFDSDNAANYGSNEIKTIYSRWINNNNKAAALVLAAKIGRRFGQTPRAISFALDPKDSSVWAGQSVNIQHRELTDFSGEPTATTFQVLSVQESNTYKYKAIEYRYAEALPEDEGGGEPGVNLIVIGGDRYNLDLRSTYDELFPAPDETTKVKVIIEGVATIGSTSASSASLTTGSWPTGAEVTLEVRGRVLGKGGFGADDNQVNGGDGGDALSMQYALTINNLGIIGGGGGGGGYAKASGDDYAGGGGGAGRNSGLGGRYSISTGSLINEDEDGSSETGGQGAYLTWTVQGETFEANAGKGGDLGQDGAQGIGTVDAGLGGSAGNAITTNGNTITYTESGDIRGSVV